MRHRFASLAAVLLFTFCLFGDPAGRGHLVLIGGGDKPAAAMAKFIELAGGKDAPIVVVPTASSEPDTPAYYRDLFGKDYGCSDVVVLDIKEKSDAMKPEIVAAAARARGIFFGGGDQIRITRALLGTPTLDAMRKAFANGAAIAGTSAGTACQSARMITGEGDFTVIRSGAVEMVEGLGFLPAKLIVDQHFLARQRSNRLLTVLLENPDHIGIGVDEDTAIWVRPDESFEVIGARSVMVLDPSGTRTRRGPSSEKGSLLGTSGVALHVLLPGEQFDLKTRRLLERELAVQK